MEHEYTSYPTWASGLSRSADDDFDEAVDELEEQENALSISAAKQRKPRSKSSSGRKPGQTILPMQKIEAIVKADLMETSAVSKEAMYMITAAAEEFTKKLAQAAYNEALQDRRTTILYRDMARMPELFNPFRFLLDTIPNPITLGEALSLREAKLQSDELDIEQSLQPLPGAFPPMIGKGKSKALPSSSRLAGEAITRGSTPKDMPRSHKNRHHTNAPALTVNGTHDELDLLPPPMVHHTNGRSSNGNHRRGSAPSPLLTRTPLPAPPSASSSRQLHERDSVPLQEPFHEEHYIPHHHHNHHHHEDHSISNSSRYHPYYAGPHIPKSPLPEASTHPSLVPIHHPHSLHHMLPPPTPPHDTWHASEALEDDAHSEYREAYAQMGHNPGRTIYSHPPSHLGP